MENLVEKSLFHVFGLWGLSKKRAGDERGLLGKRREEGLESTCNILCYLTNIHIKRLSQKCSTNRPRQLGITITIIKLWYTWNKDTVQFVSNNLTSCCMTTLMFSSSHKTDKYVRKLTDCQHRWAASQKQSDVNSDIIVWIVLKPLCHCTFLLSWKSINI